MGNLLTIEQTAARLSLCANTVRKMIHNGELEALRFNGRTVRIKQEEIERLISDSKKK